MLLAQPNVISHHEISTLFRKSALDDVGNAAILVQGIQIYQDPNLTMSSEAYVGPLSPGGGNQHDDEPNPSSPARARKFLNKWGSAALDTREDRLFSEAS